MLQLPKTPSPAAMSDPKIFLLYGPPKHGKTTVVSQLPNNLIIDLEDGSDYVEGMKIKCGSMADLMNVCALIEKEGKPYDFVTIDTVDKVEEWSEIVATNKYRQSVQGKNFPAGQSVLNLPNGGGYLWLRQAFHEALDKIFRVAKHIILIGHIRDKMIESAGKEVSAKDLDLTGKIKSIVCAKVDAIGYICRNPKNPSAIRLTFESSDTVLCGSRCEHLKGRAFEFDGGPDKFDWTKIYTGLNKPKSLAEVKVTE